MAQPPKIYMEWKVTRLEGKYRELWRSLMRALTLSNGTLTFSLVKWAGKFHATNTTVLDTASGTLHVR